MLKKLLLAGLIMAGCISASAQSTPKMSDKLAMASLINAKGETIGHVTMMETIKGLKIAIQAMGLKPGTHAIHFHEKGICQVPGFTSAGGHLNLAKKAHGMKNPKGFHMGDLPNIIVGADGTVSVVIISYLTKIKDLFKTDGASVVIHSGKDDYYSQPSGKSGEREACGKVEAIH
jgi:Cu-Zn family superoxide dismutase